MREGRQVRPRPRREMRAQFHRDDLQSAFCELSCRLARPRSDLHDRRPRAQRRPLQYLVEHLVGRYRSRTVVRLRVLIKCRPQHVSLIALPRRRHVAMMVSVRACVEFDAIVELERTDLDPRVRGKVPGEQRLGP